MAKATSKFIKGKEYLLHPLTFYDPLITGVYNNLRQDTTGRKEYIGKLTGTVTRINIRSLHAGYWAEGVVLMTRRELAWLVAEYELEPVVF